jgi:DNA (cytosine-5)-methyltransferase 1
MRAVSLFAGIGGFDLALETVGCEIVGQVEIADYPTKILERHWPHVPRIRDIRDYHGHEFGPVDIITGGYPCQPFSVAGKRDGASDPRHLWPEVNRIIRAVRPQWVLLENVPGHLSLGFGQVLGDLAESGYDAEWDCIPASAVGAPHRRDRVWIVAYPQKQPQRSRLRQGEQGGQRRRRPGDSRSEMAYAQNNRRRQGGEERPTSEPTGVQDTTRPLAHTHQSRLERRSQHRERTDQRALGPSRQPHPHHWRAEPDVGRVANGIPNRVDRLKGLGNAIVPQVATIILQRIMNAHHEH